MKKMLNFSPLLFIKEVVVPITIVTIFAFILPYTVHWILNIGFARLVTVVTVSTISSIICIELFGLTISERTFINNKIELLVHRFYREIKF